MAYSLDLTPHGRLRLETTDRLAAEPELMDAFSRSSATGLFSLAKMRNTSGPELAFWREFADTFLGELARLPDTSDHPFPKTLEPPPALGYELSLRIPAMRGAEYATPGVFLTLWQEMLATARVESATCGSLRDWLTMIHPALQLIGRVTFHLAENKRSPEQPFAFMATYTHRISSGEKPVHLPLAKALQEYAGSKNHAALRSLLEPVRRAAEASPLVRELLDSQRIFQVQAWTAPQALALLREIPAIEAAGIVARIPNWWKNGRGSRPKVSVTLGGEAGGALGIGSLLDFSIDLSLGGESLSKKELDALMRSSDGLVSLRGQWVEVDPEKLREVLAHWEKVRAESGGDGVSFLDGMRLLAGFRPANSTEDAADATIPDWSEVAAGDALREALAKLADPSQAADFDPNDGLNAQLRPYQIAGTRWLWFLQKLGLGACLADDMGLGKTLQVIALLNRLKRENPNAPGTALLIAPASLLANWQAEIRRFAPALRTAGLHPSELPPDQWKDAASARHLLTGCDLALTTYGQAARLDWLSEHPWTILILDEAQAIKNPGSKQTRAVKRIPARARIALSGTPVENRLGDLWSLFDFLNPGLLGGPTDFNRAIKHMQSATPPDFSPLRRLVSPYLLRRLKTDHRIISDLPEKTEITAWCPLAKPQAALYQKCVADLAGKLETSTGIQRRGLVLAYLMRFKQICNHPSHWLGDADYAPTASGKFSRLAELAEEIASRQEKMLVFTQFREMTAPLADFLAGIFGRPGVLLHGGTPIKQRRQLVEDFSREDGPPFFVLSLKAGGTGLNLTAASHVVHFDRWWNPAIENQATDRAFRIGQKRNVLVHKFVCRGTIEERIDALISSKKQLADSVLTGDSGAEAQLTEMSNEELLRFVALDIRGAMGD